MLETIQGNKLSSAQLILALMQKCLTATLNCKSLWQEAFVMASQIKSHTPGRLAPCVSDSDSQFSDLSTQCSLKQR